MADLVLHIRDISHPHSDDQKKVVLQVLKEIEFDESFYTKKMARKKINFLIIDINEMIFFNFKTICLG